MKISLIVGTYQRKEELKRFFESLKKQSYQNFEVILCDQNPEDFLKEIIEEYQQKFTILHLRTKRGISRARNEGLKVFSGEVVAFPDDDCVYSTDLLEKVKEYFLKYKEFDGISGIASPLDGGRFDRRFLKVASEIAKNNVFLIVVSFTLFFRRRVVEKVGFFDTFLGVGSESPFGSGEETDYVLRALQEGFKLFYLPDLVVYHPSKDPSLSGFRKEDMERARSYNRGYAYLLKKHRYPLSFRLQALIRPLGGAFLAFLRFDLKRVLYQMFKFYGRLEGFY